MPGPGWACAVAAAVREDCRGAGAEGTKANWKEACDLSRVQAMAERET
jgi:hypothetical protein